jgi:hypothetical protein
MVLGTIEGCGNSCDSDAATAGIITASDVLIGRDGARLFDARGTYVEWRSPDLEVVAAVDVVALGPWAEPPSIVAVASGDDGHAFLIERGYVDATSDQRVVIVAVDATGEARWEQTLYDRSQGARVTPLVAPDGDLIVIARAGSGTMMIADAGVEDPIVIAKLSAANGELRWVHGIATTPAHGGGTIASASLLPGGDLVIGGAIGDRLDLGGAAGALAGPGAYVARLDAGGAVVWTHVLRGVATPTIDAVAGTGDRLYALGGFERRVTLGDGTVVEGPELDSATDHGLLLALDGGGRVARTTLLPFASYTAVAATPRGAIVGGHEYHSGGLVLGGDCIEHTDEGPWGARVGLTLAGVQTCEPLGMIGARSFIAMQSSSVAGQSPAVMYIGASRVDGDRGVLAEIAATP